MNSPLFNAQRVRLPLDDKLIVIPGQYIYLSFEWLDDQDQPLDLEGHRFKIELMQHNQVVLSHEEAALGPGENVSSILVPSSTSQNLVDNEVGGVVTLRVSATDPEGYTTLLFSDSAIVEHYD